MRLLKISSVMLFSLLLVTSFQNCSKTSFTELASNDATKINANDFNQISDVGSDVSNDVHTADQTTLVNPDPLSVAANECLSAGHVFTTGGGNPVIYYRKCDAEIERWRSYGKTACCSGSVSIVDSQVYSDNQCSDGRYAGVMTCL